MRWEDLFADLEGQWAAEERRDLDSEVAERTRRERALVDLVGRLVAATGHRVTIEVGASSQITGEVADVGDGWLLLGTQSRGREWLVPLAAIQVVSGLLPKSADAGSGRRFGLGYALRAISRDRATVAVTLAGGRVRVGTIDVVGADHIDLAEHPEGEFRRAGNVRSIVTIPVNSVRLLESRPPGLAV